MLRFLFALLLSCLLTGEACAQNPTCPTRPPGTSDNSCASTAFVAHAVTGRLPNPGNLYVATTGNDANTCLSLSAACATITRAVAVAQGFDLQGADLTINLGTGTFTTGVNIGGQSVGSGNTSIGGWLRIVGNGSANSIIDPSTNCGSAPHGIFISNGVYLKLGSLKITTSCTGASDLIAGFYSYVQIIDADVEFGAASAAGSQIVAISHSNILANFKITLSGSANTALLASTQSSIVTAANVTNVLSGTPAYNIFANIIAGSFYNMGIGSHWSGTATGARYALALNSYIDTEQNAAFLPGSSAGTIANGSFYYDSTGQGCVGGAVGCRSATAPTGLGAGGTATLQPGSGDHGGDVSMVPGAGAAATGTINVALASLLGGDIGNIGFCQVNISNIGATWTTGATVQAYYDGTSTDTIKISWFNAGVALTPAGNYNIGYVCQ